MQRNVVYIWNEAPLLRVVVPLMTGIILQWYAHPPSVIAWGILLLMTMGLLIFNWRMGFTQFTLGWLNGVLVQLAFVATGVLLLSGRDVRPAIPLAADGRQTETWLILRLVEPLQEREKSYRAKAVVEAWISNSTVYPSKAGLLVYFQKSRWLANVPENVRLITGKLPTMITNHGPSAFDFQSYMALQGVYYQVRLRDGDFFIVGSTKLSPLKGFLSIVRKRVIEGIRRFVPGTREAGLAEALLIGYRDDLDKLLVQSYASTGLVHVIAISGMHLGLIYWLFAIATRGLSGRRWMAWLRPCIIIAGLWLFALLTGAGPSITRSAVMFSTLLIGQSLGRQYTAYNALAASCLLLLCFEPRWLWDAGFQLSYLALLSIFIFNKPIYHSLEFTQPFMHAIWQLCSVSLAAQVLTLPISIYLFHQFPVYFLPANLLAVPLSTVVILVELVLCAALPISPAAAWVGGLIGWLLRLLNGYIGYLEKLPLSSWKPLTISLLQTLLLYVLIAGLSLWLFQKRISFLFVALVALLFFFLLRDLRMFQAAIQSDFLLPTGG